MIGGCGYIGYHVVTRLLKTGRQVTILGRSPCPDRALDPACQYISGDYGNRALLKRILTHELEVIDLAYATVPKTSYEDAVFDLMSNLPASVGFFQEALAAGVRKVLIVSSGGTVYGPSVDLPIREDHATHPVSPYGITKLTIDRYAMMFHRTNDFPVVIVRPANAYGGAQKSSTGQGFIAAAIDAIHSNKEVEIYGKNGTIRDYIHVEDVASGVVAALDHGESGQIYNLGTGKGFSNSEVMDMLIPLANNDNIKIKIKYLPARKFDVEKNILDSSKLEICSGWGAQISLQEGLSEMWKERSVTP